MKLSITYKEIENKVKELTKVSLSLSRENDKTLNVKYSVGVIEIENKTIKVDLEEIEQAKKVLKFISLSDILINNETIDIFGEIE